MKTSDAEERRSLAPRQLRSPLATVLSFQPPSPFCHSERTRISYLTALTGAAYVVLLKENHMQLFEAATLDRKSGEARNLLCAFRVPQI